MASTLCPHKISRRATWHSLDSAAHSQLDYILASRRFKSSINRGKSRAFPGIDINSDYDLVMMTMKLKLKQNLPSHDSRLKLTLEKLKDPEVVDLFETTIGGKFAALNLLEENKTISHGTSMEHSSTLHLKYMASREEEEAIDDQRHSGSM